MTDEDWDRLAELFDGGYEQTIKGGNCGKNDVNKS